MTRLALALILAAAPAFAEDPNWNGDPEPEPPVEQPEPEPEPPTEQPEPEPEPPVVPPAEPPVTAHPEGGGSEYTSYARIYYGKCTCAGYTVAWGFETPEFRAEMAREQCRVLNVKRQCEVTDQEYGAGEGKW